MVGLRRLERATAAEDCIEEMNWDVDLAPMRIDMASPAEEPCMESRATSATAACASS